MTAVAAPDSEPGRAGLTLRGWLETHPRPTHESPFAELHYASLEVSESAFRTMFAGVPFEPVPVLKYRAYGGWEFEFHGGGEVFMVRVTPQATPEFTHPQLEISALGQRWHHFSSVDTLRAAVDLLSELPF